MSVSLILAVGGVAVLIGAGVVLFLTVRSRNNPVGAFLVGLVAAAIAFMVVSIPIENMTMGSDNELMLLTGFVMAVAAALLASLFVVNRFFPATTSPQKTRARSTEPRNITETETTRRAATSAPLKPSADVFISYKRDERAEVYAIAQRLEALKLRVWFDAEMRSGTTFDAEIDRQVRDAKAVLVCWSPGAVASDWVRGEAMIGRERGVLAAAILKPCSLPAPFNLVHADNLASGIGPRNPEWLAAVERIGALAGRPGLASYERLELGADKAAYAAWIAANSGDPLLEAAVERLKRL
jgi:hypothetical protein